MKRLTVAASLLLLACAAPARADPPQLISDVETASVSRTGPDTVVVCARGTVTTGGWTRPGIVVVRRISHNGVYDLDFTAVKPEGMATQMISPISVRFVWTGSAADLKGVRVRGERSAALADLGQGGGC